MTGSSPAGQRDSRKLFGQNFATTPRPVWDSQDRRRPAEECAEIFASGSAPLSARLAHDCGSAYSLQPVSPRDSEQLRPPAFRELIAAAIPASAPLG